MMLWITQGLYAATLGFFRLRKACSKDWQKMVEQLQEDEQCSEKTFTYSHAPARECSPLGSQRLGSDVQGLHPLAG